MEKEKQKNSCSIYHGVTLISALLPHPLFPHKKSSVAAVSMKLNADILRWYSINKAQIFINIQSNTIIIKSWLQSLPGRQGCKENTAIPIVHRHD